MSDPEHAHGRKRVVDPAQAPDARARVIGDPQRPDHEVVTDREQLDDVAVEMREQSLLGLLLSEPSECTLCRAVGDAA